MVEGDGGGISECFGKLAKNLNLLFFLGGGGGVSDFFDKEIKSEKKLFGEGRGTGGPWGGERLGERAWGRRGK